MAFTVEFTIPSEVLEAVSSEAAWTHVEKISTKQLIQYLKKWVKSKGWSLSIRECAVGELGCHFLPSHEIWLDPRLTFQQLPAVMIHESLHGIFQQLDEEKILALEFKIMKEASEKAISSLVHSVFRYGKWKYVGPYLASVGTGFKPKKNKTTKLRSSKRLRNHS